MTAHDDADPDDAGLASLRAAFRSLPDEEPSPRGLAELMAAARVKADEMAAATGPAPAAPPQPSWWQRFLAGVRQPQVLALATIVILIGGGVFVSQRRDALEAPSPAATQESAPAATAPASALPEGSLDTGAEPPRPEEIAPAAIPAEPPAPEPSPATVPQSAGETRQRTLQPEPARTATPKKPAKRATRAPAREEAALGIDTEETGVSRAPVAGGAVRVDAAPTLPQLHTQARAAAERGDCATVRRLANQISTQDAAYYRANVAPDAVLASCLGS